MAGPRQAGPGLIDRAREWVSTRGLAVRRGRRRAERGVARLLSAGTDGATGRGRAPVRFSAAPARYASDLGRIAPGSGATDVTDVPVLRRFGRLIGGAVLGRTTLPASHETCELLAVCAPGVAEARWLLGRIAAGPNEHRLVEQENARRGLEWERRVRGGTAPSRQPAWRPRRPSLFARPAAADEGSIALLAALAFVRVGRDTRGNVWMFRGDDGDLLSLSEDFYLWKP
jgi:hypothetical protein